MRKILFVLVFLQVFLSAEVQNAELLANKIFKDKKLVHAKGNVLVYTKMYAITADEAVYNEENGDLELFDNVNIIRGQNDSVTSKYAKINLKTDTGIFEPFFTYNDQKQMWIECQKAIGEEKFYITKNSITSSCNVQNPDWKIAFSKGKLNKKTKFLQLQNVVFYVADFPIFYLPYFAISTDTTRRTGFLIPSVGFGRADGLFYKQPIYIAEDSWWDLELNPQIRTSRGYGLYSKFRFVDSLYSDGSLIVGGFKDKSSYVKKENLKNSFHKGFEFRYQNSKLLERYLADSDDGLWVDLTYLNDIDFLNLQDNNDRGYGNLVTSRLNYHLKKENDYLGLYAKYYIDTEKVNNDDTLQELPTFQYHHFLNSIIFPNLLYSFDLQYHRYSRKEGVNAQQVEANLPISLYGSFFDDFLHVSVSENIYATYVKYSNLSRPKSDSMIKNYHLLSAYTDLAKAYEDFYHTIRIGAEYTIPSWNKGDIEEDFIENDILNENLKFGLTQFFHDKNGNKKIKHSIKQVFFFEDNMYRYADIENFLSYYFTKDIYIKNELNYSYEHKHLSKAQTSLHVEYDNYFVDLMHTFEYNNKNEKQNFLIATLEAKYKNNYSFFGGTNYNIEEGYAQSWNVGVKKSKKCWNFTFSYKEGVNPKLTSSGADYIRKNGFYLAFELYPLGGTEYDFSTESIVNEK